jgi:hypothetical protein
MKFGKIKKLILCLFYLYILTLPFTESLVYKIYGKVGYDNLILFFIFILCIAVITFNVVSKIKLKKIKIKDDLVFNFLSMYFVSFLFPFLSGLLFFKSFNSQQITRNLSFLQVFPIAIILFFVITDKKIFQKITVVFLISAAITSVIGLLQILGMDYFWEIAQKYYIPAEKGLYGTFIDRTKAPAFFGQTGNTFGAFMVFSFIILFVLKDKLIKNNIIRILLLILLFSGVLASFSITSIITLIIIIFIYFILIIIFNDMKIFMKIKKSKLYLILFSVVSVVVILMLSIGKIFGRFAQKISALTAGRDRYGIWIGYIEDLKNRSLTELLIGRSYAETGILDNFYLQLLASGGILLLSIYIFFLIKLLLISFTRGKYYYKNNEILSRIYIAIFLLLIGMSIMNFTAAYAAYQQIILSLLLLIVGATKFHTYNKNSNKLKESHVS